LAVEVLASMEAMLVKMDEINAETREVLKIASECREIARQCGPFVIESPSICGDTP
jgi:hypothetical protein